MNGFLVFTLLVIFSTEIHGALDNLIYDLYINNYAVMDNNYQQIESRQMDVCNMSAYTELRDIGFQSYTTEIERQKNLQLSLDYETYFKIPAVIKCTPGDGYILIISLSIEERDLCLLRIFPFGKKSFHSQQAEDRLNLDKTFSNFPQKLKRVLSRQLSMPTDKSICENLIEGNSITILSGETKPEPSIVYLTKNKGVYVPGYFECHYVQRYDTKMKVFVKGKHPEKWIEIQPAGYRDNATDRPVYYHGNI